VDRFDNIRVFGKVLESSSFAGGAAPKGFQVDRPRLTFLSVLVRTLAKGSDDRGITRIPMTIRRPNGLC
jgi:hypothetical protein